MPCISRTKTLFYPNIHATSARVFVTADEFRNHKRNKCEIETIERFSKESKIYQTAKNRISKLMKKYGMEGDNYIDHFIVYVFEVILKKINIQHGEHTEFTNKHVPVSVSICDSLTRDINCFVNKTSKQLITEMFAYCDHLSVRQDQ